MPAQPCPSGSPPEAVPADAADAGALSQLIADAFHDLPQSHWLIPDQDARRKIMPGYFRIYVEHALANGVVQTTPDRAAVALWLPTGIHPPAPGPDYAARLTAATAPWTDRFRAFDATLECHHPAGTAHHHLAVLAVQPGRQGRGIGTALLRAHHATLDDAGMPSYLEAADLRSRQLYLRHGYVLQPNAPFHLPGGGPVMWPLWRHPRPHAAASIPSGGQRGSRR
jgi:GNAT superfamily N-acetyltransferase